MSDIPMRYSQPYTYQDEAYYAYRQDGANFMETNGPIGLIALPGTEEFVNRINQELYTIRFNSLQRYAAGPMKVEPGFIRHNYVINASINRFSSGEAKATLHDTVRGHDVYIFCDVTNRFVSYPMFGMDIPYSPDDHFQNIKRIILASSGKSRNISVVMPFLYEGRQDYSSSRESMDAANMLKELNRMGVKNIITFDPHDARVENAIPLYGIENIPTSYSLLKALLSDFPDEPFSDPNYAMIISPDENGLKRATYYASMLGLQLGTFYRERDYVHSDEGYTMSTNYKFLGEDIEGKVAILIDDMINSGDTLISTAKRLKDVHGASRVIMLVTYPIFTSGMDDVHKAYEDGYIDKIYGTNLSAHSPELQEAPWYRDVDMSVMTAELIDALNHQASISGILDQSAQIADMIKRNADQMK
jgi:ribose-phosphate pyrophosphokinase